MKPKKICIATSTRADWGLLTPLAQALAADTRAEVSVLATNMHLMPEFGHTIDEIYAAGFKDVREVPMPIADASAEARAIAMAHCMQGAAHALASINPDYLIILGDRFEMLAIAAAALTMRVKIAHIAGGETSLGAIDDNIRHAITQLASLHFTETEPYRKRVIAMGKNPDTVCNAGSLGVWNILNQTLLGKADLCKDLNFDFEEKQVIIATLHPATLNLEAEKDACPNLLKVLEKYSEFKIVITYPNNDEGSERIIELLNSWAPGRENVLLVKSLGMKRYLSLLQYAATVVGNSSSGIIEVPSMGVPTVDIGSRQQGRIAAPSVIHCGTSAQEIGAAIDYALSPEMQKLAAWKENPYCQPNTVKLIMDRLLD